MGALLKIQQAGFDVSLTDAGGLAIAPASLLNDSQREFLKQHKSEIVKELELMQAQPANDNTDPFDDRHYCHECQCLINGRCITQRFRPFDDIPRRCSDFINRGEPLNEVIERQG
jgi:hypothetical protein